MTLPMIGEDLTFEGAARLVLGYLEKELPLALWSVTRVENGRQTFLFLNEGNGYGKVPGDSHAWEDSFCVHMVAGAAPHVAPTAQAIPRYAAAAVNGDLAIGAYAGAPIADTDGELFGAICGLDPEPGGDDRLAEAGPLLVLLGQLLTMVLAGDRERNLSGRSLLEAMVAAETDSLTGLYNRRAWERIIADETLRFARHADPTVIAILDLDHLKAINDRQGHAAGDDYLARAAQAVKASIKSSDVVARLGGDEFAILFRRCSETQAAAAIHRITTALRDEAVDASLGWATVTVSSGFPAALAKADEAMYAAKRGRRPEPVDSHRRTDVTDHPLG